MSTELTQPITVTNPITGEVLELSAPTPDLAQFIADVRDAESMLGEAKRYVSAEIIARLDKGASRKQRLENGLEISAPSPQPLEEFDAAGLHEALQQLAIEGVIYETVASEAVVPVIEYKVQRRVVNGLRKLGGRVEETINRFVTKVEKDRYVKVTRL